MGNEWIGDADVIDLAGNFQDYDQTTIRQTERVVRKPFTQYKTIILIRLTKALRNKHDPHIKHVMKYLKMGGLRAPLRSRQTLKVQHTHALKIS